MRIFAATFGICLAAIAAVGVFTSAWKSVQAMSLKQNQELNAEIDRIVAEHNDKKRQLAQSAQSVPTATAPKTDARKASLQLTAAQETTGSAEELAEGGGRLEKAFEPVEVHKETLTDRQKAPKKKTRHVAHRQHLLPIGFLSLPKFTAYTLLGIR